MDARLQPDEVADAGVLGQRALLSDSRLTAVELVDLCLARIDRLDPTLNAFRTATAPGRRRPRRTPRWPAATTARCSASRSPSRT